MPSAPTERRRISLSSSMGSAATRCIAIQEMENYPSITEIMKDLIPHVDATYRTVASRESRAVEGFSMGGFGAAHLGFKYPEVFGLVSIEARALLGPHVEGHDPVQAWAKLFPTALGSDMDYFQANDPFTLAVKNADALRDRTLIRIATHRKPGEWQSGRCDGLREPGV
jgi:S-formylglutathione hydrolase FrmB